MPFKILAVFAVLAVMAFASCSKEPMGYLELRNFTNGIYPSRQEIFAVADSSTTFIVPDKNQLVNLE